MLTDKRIFDLAVFTMQCTLASCTCMTKNPDIEYHTDNCHYKKFREIHTILYELYLSRISEKREIRRGIRNGIMDDTEELKAKIIELEDQIVCSKTSITRLHTKLNHIKKLQRYKIEAKNSYTTDHQGDFILYSDLNATING